MTIIHWLRKQNIGVKFKKQNIGNLFGRLDFLYEGMKSGMFKKHDGEPSTIFLFIFFFLMNEIQFITKQKNNYTEYIKSMFSLYCWGINHGTQKDVTENIEGAKK